MKRIKTVLPVLLIISVVSVAGCTGGGAPSEESGDKKVVEGTEYSGTWKSNDGQFSGTWEFTVDEDTGDIAGSVSGDITADVSGSVSNGEISATGTAMGGTVTWSGSISSDGSSVSGTWDMSGPMSTSGTWEGSKTGTTEQESPSPSEGGSGTETTQTSIGSIDITLKGYESDELEGSTRVRAREYDKEEQDFRIEPVDGEEVFIYNNNEEAFYVYSPDKDKWTKVSGTYAEQMGYDSYVGLSDFVKNKALGQGTGTFTVTYGDQKEAELVVNEVNPTFSDDLFKPPSDATVNEFSTD